MEEVAQLQMKVGDRMHLRERERANAGKPKLSEQDRRQLQMSVIAEVLDEHAEELAVDGSRLDRARRFDLQQSLEAQLFGSGRLQDLLEDPEVENVDINGHDNVFVSRRGQRPERERPIARSDDELIEIIQGIASSAGGGLNSRMFDPANPELDLRLADGSRLSATHSAISSRVTVSIRRNTMSDVTLGDLVSNGTLTREVAQFLWSLVQARFNVMIAGATNAGKTTLLRAVVANVPEHERLITVERTLELGLDHPNIVELEEKQPNSDGVGAVSLARLVRRSLRMNPDRVIVGEVLGDEVITMLNAMSQGNDGSLSTIHANSAIETFHRISTYALQAPERLPTEGTHHLISGALDFIVFVRKTDPNDHSRGSEMGRIVDEVLEVGGVDDNGRVTHSSLYKSADGVSPATQTGTPVSEKRVERIRALVEVLPGSPWAARAVSAQ